jgi:molybdopterin synthase catalytic subunit
MTRSFLLPASCWRRGADGGQRKMTPRTTVAITRRPLSFDAARRAVARPDCGGICVFAGTVRNLNEGRRVSKIRYSAFEGMALRQFKAIAADARKKFGLRAVYIAHRVGLLKVGEASVLCAEASGCRHLIERVKKMAPIWKEEFHGRGKSWVNRT